MRLPCRTRPAVLLALFCLSTSLRADDWPQWRGPLRDGGWREKGIVESFPPGGPTVRWRVPVGPGWSSPVVAAGRVYLTAARLAAPKARERALCFDAATGRSLWTYSYDVVYPDWAFTDKPGRGPTATPLIHDGKAYTLGNKGDLHCLDATKGTLLWKRNLEKDYGLQEFAFNSSPLIEGDLLVLCVGSYPNKPGPCVLALDRRSGKEVWRALDEGLTNSSPLAITAGGQRQLIVWTRDSVTSLAPATGKPYWQERLTSAAADAVSSPVFHDGLLFVGRMMWKLDADKPAASVLWPDARKARVARNLSNTSTALLQGDHLFSANSAGQLVCLEARTGKPVWQTDKVTALRSGASIHLVPNGGSVLLYTDRGVLIRARLTGKGYEEAGRTSLLKPPGARKAWAAPACANRHLFVRDDEQLICVSLAATP